MISKIHARRAGKPAASLLVTAFIAFLSPISSLHAQSPYRQSFRALSDLVVNVEMDPDSQVAGRVRAGTGGLRINWCEPDIPVAEWSGADDTERRLLLDGRWCEIDTGSVVGNVRSNLLAPE